MSIRRRKSQLEKNNPMSTKKRLDERIKQHVQRFRVQRPNNNDKGNNNVASPVARELTPPLPSVEQQDYIGFVSDLFPDSAFVDQTSTLHPATLTGSSQIVPNSYITNMYTQDFINSLQTLDYPSSSQAVPNNNSSLDMVLGDMTQMQIQMVNEQPQQQRRHHHPLQHYVSAPDLYAGMAGMAEQVYITPHVAPAIQLNNQLEPLSTAAATQTATQIQKPRKAPSRPNPPTFKNGPTNVRASTDLLKHFYTFDTDGSGAISFDELQACLKNREASKSRHFNSEVITILIEMFDNNNDGMIDILEFPELIAYLRNWNRCFQFLDENKNGTLDYPEMHHAISEMGLTVSHSLMKEIMKKYEYTENKIDLDNFILCCVTLYRHKETYEFMKETGGATYSHIELEEFLRMMLKSSGTKQYFNTLPIV